MKNAANLFSANRKLLSCLLLGAVVWGIACTSDNNGGGLDGAVAGGTVGNAGAGGTGPIGGNGPTDGGLPGVDAPAAAACQSDLQCTPLGLLCDTKRQRCAQCLSNTQCKTDERCVSGTCEKFNKCVNSLDCAGLPGGQTICDESFGECVVCAKAADCAMNQDCLGHKCVTYTPCKNSLDCPQGTVCETQIGRCYQCTRDADCGTDRVCAGNSCRTKCASDNQCTSLGLLCNAQGGFCAECLKDEDCPQEQYCGAGQCRPDICRPGSSSCTGAAAQTCNAAGSGFDAPRPCAARQTCVASGGAASCKNWACSADTVECVDRTVVTCSKDGLRVIASVDCALNNQYCSNAACSDRVCTPNGRHCYMDDVYNCDATGLVRTLNQNCSDTTQYCDGQAATAVCAARVCTPGTPTCNGNTATTCNANGSGYVAGGTDCAATGGVCRGGACIPPSCTDGIKNQGETDVDCGGATGCPRCVDFKNCAAPTDCATNACTMNFCGTIGCKSFGSGGGYTGCERTVAVANLPCVDIRATGTRTGVGNDSSIAVPLPFSFNFYGVARNMVQISSAATLNFNASTSSTSNSCLPSAGNPLVSVFWEHLHPDGNVYYQTFGNAPNRRFEVQWYSVVWAAGGTFLDLRAVLNEGSNDIEVCYAATTAGAGYDQGLSSTAGIQDGAAAALQYSCNAARLTDGLVLDYLNR